MILDHSGMKPEEIKREFKRILRQRKMRTHVPKLRGCTENVLTTHMKRQSTIKIWEHIYIPLLAVPILKQLLICFAPLYFSLHFIEFYINGIM